MLQVLRIAAGDEPAIGEATATTERSPKSLQEAAAFYVVQILLSSGVDSYRTLGANTGASREELRTHMVWLLKWLHPDTHEGQPHTVFAKRVIKAWESLRSDESRGRYDIERLQSGPRKAGRPVMPRLRPAVHAGTLRRPGTGRSRALRRWAVPVVLGSLAASCVALASLYFVSLVGSTGTSEPDLLQRFEAATSFRH